MNELTVNILRGENKIGENLIEITDKKSKLLLECGVAITPTEETRKIEECVLETLYDAIIVSHSHMDHAGLLKNKVQAKEIYMGKSTYELLCYTDAICNENIGKIRYFESEKSFFIGEIEIKPYLCDHSSFDSYMIEIKKGEDNVLYTGDFRSNGRKSFTSLLSKLPNKVSTLIIEATNDKECNHTERYLEEKVTEIMKKHDMVFFLQSRLNIDRLVSFYRATRRVGKPFIMGIGSAGIARIGKTIPNPQSFIDCYTYLRSRANEFEYTNSKNKYKQKLIGRCQIAEMQSFSMQVMCGMGDYLEKLNSICDLKGSVLIYSMWQGYKRSASVRKFLETVSRLGIEIVDFHVSGHADIQTRKRLIEKVNPKTVITVHSHSQPMLNPIWSDK